jgi:uncharacterized membrane protein YdbT with pleckstrin-like domain
MTPVHQGSPAAFQEETLWRGTPSWTLLAGRIAIVIVTLAVIPALHFLSRGGEVDDATMGWIRIGFWITLIVLCVEAVWLLVGLIQIRSTLYTLTNQRLMIETGILSKSLSEIDLRYIDDTQFGQSLVDRLLGIGNVTIISSDKSTPTTVLRSIRDPRGIREMIRTHAYQVSHRQIFTRAT